MKFVADKNKTKMIEEGTKMKKMMMVVMAIGFLFFVFSTLAVAGNLPPCNFGADPFLKEGRALMPYEKVMTLTAPISLSMWGGKHRKSPGTRPYKCEAPAGTEFITVPDPFNPRKRVATEVYPCFNPVVNAQWGLGRVVFDDTAPFEAPPPKKSLTAEELYGPSGLEAPKKRRLEKKTGKSALVWSTVAVIAAGAASYKHRDGFLVPLFVGPIAGGVGGYFEGEYWSGYDFGIGFAVGATGGLITHSMYKPPKPKEEEIPPTVVQQPPIGQGQPPLIQQPPIGEGSSPIPASNNGENSSGDVSIPPISSSSSGGSSSSSGGSTNTISQPSGGGTTGGGDTPPPRNHPIINAP